MADGGYFAGAFGGRDNLLALFNRRGDGLFEQNVPSALQCGDSGVAVGAFGRADDGGVDLDARRYKLVDSSEAGFGGQRCLAGKLGERVGIDVDRRYYAGALGVAAHPFKIGVRPVSCSYECQPYHS